MPIESVKTGGGGVCGCDRPHKTREHVIMEELCRTGLRACLELCRMEVLRLHDLITDPKMMRLIMKMRISNKACW